MGDETGGLFGGPGGMSKLLGRSPTLRIKQRSRVLCLCLHGDTLITGGAVSGEICLSNSHTGELDEVLPQKDLPGHLESVTVLRIAFGRLWSGSTDKCIRVWDITPGSPRCHHCVAEIPQHKALISAFALGGDHMWTASEDSTIRGYNAAKIAGVKPGDAGAMERAARPTHLLEGHEASVAALVYRGGRLWSSSADGTVRQWDPLRRRCVGVMSTGVQLGGGLMVSAKKEGGCVVCSSVGGAIVQLDLEGKVIRRLQGHQQVVRDLFLWDDKNLLFSCAKDETIKLWDLEEGELLETLFGHEKSVNCIALRGSCLFSGATDKHTFSWDLSELLGDISPRTTDARAEAHARAPVGAGCCAVQ